MARVMVFIDGTWLYYTRRALEEEYGKPGFQIDYGLLPKVLASKVAEGLAMPEIDIVRTYFFGSYADNYDLRDDELVQERLDFYAMLKEECHYEAEIFPINFFTRRLRRQDRDPTDDFEPKEKCVDIALATSMLYFAAIPYAYDIAIAVIGDRDFMPVLQTVRRLGKRVAIASIRKNCAAVYADPQDPARVKDFDIIWLNDILNKIELKYERQQLECQSPLHRGPKKMWTMYRPPRGKPFYCEDCRKKFAEQKAAAQAEYLAPAQMSPLDSKEEALKLSAAELEGKIVRKIEDRGFGFIATADGKEYFFHLTDLEAGIEWQALQKGQGVVFKVKREPELGKAGAAMRVRSSSKMEGVPPSINDVLPFRRQDEL